MTPVEIATILYSLRIIAEVCIVLMLLLAVLLVGGNNGR